MSKQLHHSSIEWERKNFPLSFSMWKKNANFVTWYVKTEKSVRRAKKLLQLLEINLFYVYDLNFFFPSTSLLLYLCVKVKWDEKTVKKPEYFYKMISIRFMRVEESSSVVMILHNISSSNEKVKKKIYSSCLNSRVVLMTKLLRMFMWEQVQRILCLFEKL